MNLIERYIYQVIQYVPASQQKDIAQELRASIADMVAAKSKRGKNEEKVIKSVLSELGDPHLLAQEYSERKVYLIGPMWFGTYLQTLKKILSTALPIFFGVMIILKLMTGNDNYPKALLQIFGQTFNVGIQIIFWTTVIFVLFERYKLEPKELGIEKQSQWTPEALPDIPKKRQIPVAESVANIIFTTIGLIFITFSDRFIHIEIVENVPLFNPTSWEFWLPVFFGLAGLNIVLEVFKLSIGQWTIALMIANGILGLISIAYLLVLVSFQELINPAFIEKISQTAEAKKLGEVGYWIFRTVITFIIMAYVWEVVKSIRLHLEYKKHRNGI